LVTTGSPEIIEQITKQLNKLIDVIRLVELDDTRSIERELMLVKLRAAGGEQREEMKRLVDIFGAQIVDVTESTYTVELVGDGNKLNAFLAVVSTKRILEVIRSGVLGILRGTKALRA
jgi:acetolactate synthase-1/3 small subunit